MAIYHCTIQVIGRGTGRSAVAAAAYRSGSQLLNEWSGLPADFRRKTGIVRSEIMLPENAPETFSDRQILWNSVEKNEKRADAQLAREIEVALPAELSLEEHVKIIHEYCQQFVDSGMCVDFNIHDKKDGNPHCHIMLTMRALDENGKWLPKSHQEYELDETGERIRLPSGRYKSKKVCTTDWGNHDKAELWRTSWEEIVNRYLEKNQVPERIDHRSNTDRGIEEIPTIHIGPAACAMEKKGISTERGEINRKIRAANRLLAELREKLLTLKNWLAELMGKLKHRESSPKLKDLMELYLEEELREIQNYSGPLPFLISSSSLDGVRESVDRLENKGIHTVEDLDESVTALREKVSSTQQAVVELEHRMKELEKLIENGRDYLKYDPIHHQSSEIRWKSKKTSFDEEHRSELALWGAASRFLHGKAADLSSLPDQMKDWQRELTSLTAEHDQEYARLKEYRAETKELDSVRRKVDQVLRKARTKEKTWEREI